MLARVYLIFVQVFIPISGRYVQFGMGQIKESGKRINLENMCKRFSLTEEENERRLRLRGLSDLMVKTTIFF